MRVLDEIKKAIEIEADATKELANQISFEYEEAINMIRNSKGKVIFTGVGKSGHVGKKLAATFASTGTPSFFLHSTEGVHGDLGMVEESDIVIMLSNSGETKELLSLLPSLKKIKAKTIVVTSKKESSLAKKCDIVLTYEYKKEADHLELAPTTSSTLTLVLGDAIAITLCKLKGFTNEDFHLFHPGGNLGKRLSK